MEERVSYAEIRAWFLECYYQYCQTKLFHLQQWVAGEYEFGFAYEEYSNAFSSDVERLMLEVLTLILAAGRGQVETFHRERIAELLSGIDLQTLLAELPYEEAEEFRRDLNILKLI
ncbi:Imm2 family immunity protein [Neisseriaceae bacterium JH1-16]|nr:Imm2 family immunity protein [Neisseriaceae bacterium JH1-16]